MHYFDYPIEIEELDNQAIVIFTLAGCETCQKLIKLLDKIKPDVKIYVLDAISGGKLGPKYSIMSAPTTIKFANRQEIDRIYGAPNIDRLNEFLKF